MLQLILTSHKFEGEIEVIYDSAGLLVYLDMRRSKMTELQIIHLKHHLRAKYSENKSDWDEMFKTFTFVPKDYKIPFDMFWNEYGKKINLLRAEKVWNRLSESNKVKAYLGLKAYLKYCTDNVSWYNKLDPENYLKNQSWTNEWK